MQVTFAFVYRAVMFELGVNCIFLLGGFLCSLLWHLVATLVGFTYIYLDHTCCLSNLWPTNWNRHSPFAHKELKAFVVDDAYLSLSDGLCFVTRRSGVEYCPYPVLCQI